MRRVRRDTGSRATALRWSRDARVLTFWALAMSGTLILLILSGRVSPLVVLILTPVAFGLLAGFGGELGAMMLKGVGQLAPTAVMLSFAILYFSVMVDAHLFDPVVRWVVRWVHANSVRLVVGTALLALVVSLDGNGATAYLICVSALLPLYRKFGLSPLLLAGVLVLSVAIGHVLPWAGPTARVASVLGVDPSDVYVPLVPALLAGAAFVAGLAAMLARRARGSAVVASNKWSEAAIEGTAATDAENEAVSAVPVWRMAANALLTLALLTSLVLSLLPAAILFMIGAAVALQLNSASLILQRAQIAAHAPQMIRVAALTFAVGIYLGVLQGTGMSEEMGVQVVGAISPALARFMAPVAMLVSLPFYYFVSNDAFYFGVLPALAKAAALHGITPVQMARAAVIGIPLGLLSPLAASTYVLVSLVGVEFAQLQRYVLKWAVLLTLVVFAASLVTGAIPWRGPT
jgi:CitMHS family citrate-Mg2+:H+ or citrate-Ca2+:H+ symporter